MGKPTQVTYDRVKHAAEELVANGRSVTTDHIREVIGVPSGNTTVGPHLKRWVELQKKQDTISIEDLPAEIAEMGTRFLTSVWHSAVKDASIGLEALRREFVAARNASNTREADLDETVSKLEAERDDAREHAEVQIAAALEAKEIAELSRAHATDAERELARMTEKSKALEEKVLAQELCLGEAKASLEQAIKKLVDATNTIAQLREASVARASAHDALEESLAQEKELSRAAEHRALKAEERISKAEGRADIAHAERQAAKADFETEKAAHLNTKRSLDDALSMIGDSLEAGATDKPFTDSMSLPDNKSKPRRQP